MSSDIKYYFMSYLDDYGCDGSIYNKTFRNGVSREHPFKLADKNHRIKLLGWQEITEEEFRLGKKAFYGEI